MTEFSKYDSNLGDWIIDTDPGVDDAFAITLALNFIKDNLKLISIESGNVGVDQCVKNAKKLCVLNKRKIDISQGSSLTLSTQSLKCFAGIHGTDGFFDFTEYEGLDLNYLKSTDFINSDWEKRTILKSHSAIEIVKLVQKYDNLNSSKINLLTIGPLTNIALAYMLDPSIVSKINRVVVMGGAYSDLGNICASGEFNFACDNVAAKLVFDNFLNITVYCWEPSVKHLIYPEHVKTINSTPKCEFITKCIKKKMEWNQGGIYADYGGAVAAFKPESVINSKAMYVDIVIDSSIPKQSRFMASSSNIFHNKDKRPVEIIYDMNMTIFHKLINKMLESEVE